MSDHKPNRRNVDAVDDPKEQKTARAPSQNAFVTLPVDVEDLLKDLYYLGDADDNTKLNVSDKKIVAADSVLNSVVRTVKGEGKEKSLVPFLQKVVNKLNTIVTHYSDNQEIMAHIVAGLDAGKNGLSKLSKTTYRSYANIRAEIRVTMVNFDIVINHCKQHKP